MYNYEETQEQKDAKKEYKERFRLKYAEKLQNIENEEVKYGTIDKEPKEREEAIDEAIDDSKEDFNEELAREVEMVETFLSCFIFATSSKIEN